MHKIINEYKTSVKQMYESEGWFGGILWAVTLPIFMISAVITDSIYGH